MGGGEGAALPSVLFATEGGVLGSTASAAGASSSAAVGRGGLTVSSRLLGSTGGNYHQGAAINSFDIETGVGRDVICVTDSSELVYIRRRA